MIICLFANVKPSFRAPIARGLGGVLPERRELTKRRILPGGDGAGRRWITKNEEEHVDGAKQCFWILFLWCAATVCWMFLHDFFLFGAKQRVLEFWDGFIATFLVARQNKGLLMVLDGFFWWCKARCLDGFRFFGR